MRKTSPLPFSIVPVKNVLNAESLCIIFSCTLSFTINPNGSILDICFSSFPFFPPVSMNGFSKNCSYQKPGKENGLPDICIPVYSLSEVLEKMQGSGVQRRNIQTEQCILG